MGDRIRVAGLTGSALLAIAVPVLLIASQSEPTPQAGPPMAAPTPPAFASIEGLSLDRHALAIAISTADELESALLRASKGREALGPILVLVTRADGDQMGIGLGLPYSVLTYTAGDLDPPYFISVGRAEVLTGREVVFYLQGEYTEFLPRNAVPLRDAIKAVRAFVESRGLPLPSVVEWEEV